MYEDYTKKIIYNINSLRKTYPKVNELVKYLEFQGNPILIGGAVRDIIYDRCPRDYDFVIDTHGKDLNVALDDIYINRNSFGGYKIIIDNITFDVWALRDTWALRDKNNIVSKYDLVSSCFFNLDSIFFDIKNSELMYKNFEKGIKDKMLDIIYEPNLYPSVCIVRAIVLKDKFNLSFSTYLKKYISDWVCNNKVNYIKELKNAQIKHYKKIVLQEAKLKEELEYI